MKKAALYARVSTSDQSSESQMLDLRRYSEQRGWTIFNEYTDEGISGTKGSRPPGDVTTWQSLATQAPLGGLHG